MDFNYRQRNYMAPNFGFGNLGGFSSGSFASPPQIPKPFTGMEIQGPLGSIPGQSNTPPEIDMPNQRPRSNEFDIFEHMYNAPTPALEAYKRHIMSMPQQGEYKANKFDRVAAALTGAAEGLNRGAGAGYLASRAIIDRPYAEAMQNYQSRGQGLGELANLESQDMKSKMNYAKTAMEQRRADVKEFREGMRDSALNRLTDAQIENLRTDMKLKGLEIVDNVATGEKEVINKATGERTSLGKFLQTLEEKEKSTIRINQAQANAQGANQINLEGVRNKNQTARDEVAHGRAVELGQIAHTYGMQRDQNKRLFDALNPIPYSGNQFTQPSQDQIALETAIFETSNENPEYSKYTNPNLTPAQKAEFAKDPDYQTFVSKYQNRKKEILDRSRPVGNVGRLKVEIPGISGSPLDAPGIKSSPERQAAIDQLKKDNQPVTEEMINWMMQQQAR